MLAATASQIALRTEDKTVLLEAESVGRYNISFIVTFMELFVQCWERRFVILLKHLLLIPSSFLWRANLFYFFQLIFYRSLTTNIRLCACVFVDTNVCMCVSVRHKTYLWVFTYYSLTKLRVLYIKRPKTSPWGTPRILKNLPHIQLLYGSPIGGIIGL